MDTQMEGSYKSRMRDTGKAFQSTNRMQAIYEKGISF
jgi:hypothetical protein